MNSKEIEQKAKELYPDKFVTHKGEGFYQEIDNNCYIKRMAFKTGATLMSDRVKELDAEIKELEEINKELLDLNQGFMKMNIKLQAENKTIREQIIKELRTITDKHTWKDSNACIMIVDELLAKLDLLAGEPATLNTSSVDHSCDGCSNEAKTLCRQHSNFPPKCDGYKLWLDKVTKPNVEGEK